MAPRSATTERITSETNIQCTVSLDGTGESEISTGLGFLDHMLQSFSKHSRIDIMLSVKGDLHIDDHHTVEDTALTLGEALRQAIGDGRGIERFGNAYIPMDEALARAAIDLSGRPASVINLDLKREMLGEVACENFTHFFRSLSTALRCALHIDVLRGENDHHRAEAAFKACARALKEAVRRDSSSTSQASIPSTKGVIYG
jgi:imidazoleglycerol phosphate dehydratase HisB